MCYMCQGLLDLEGSLAPILFHLVKRDVNKLLDNAFAAEEAMAKLVHHKYELSVYYLLFLYI